MEGEAGDTRANPGPLRWPRGGRGCARPGTPRPRQTTPFGLLPTPDSATSHLGERDFWGAAPGWGAPRCVALGAGPDAVPRAAWIRDPAGRGARASARPLRARGTGSRLCRPCRPGPCGAAFGVTAGAWPPLCARGDEPRAHHLSPQRDSGGDARTPTSPPRRHATAWHPKYLPLTGLPPPRHSGTPNELKGERQPSRVSGCVSRLPARGVPAPPALPEPLSVHPSRVRSSGDVGNASPVARGAWRA